MELKKAALFTVLVSVLVFCLCSQFVSLAWANFLPVPTPQPNYTIKSDGTIEPSTAPIKRSGSVYTLTGDVFNTTIAIEKDNSILDGGGFTLYGTGQSSTGVFIYNHRGITVRNMNIKNHGYGIRIGTDVFHDYPDGSHVVSGNNLTENKYGIYIVYSCNNVLTNNKLNNNNYALYVADSPLNQSISHFVNDIGVSNTVNGKPVCYWVNQHDRSVPSDAGYVCLLYCSNILAQNLDLTGKSEEIILYATYWSQITGCNITNNDGNGISLSKSCNNSVSLNTIANNGKYGIYIDNSENNDIFENTITSNFKGIEAYNSGSNNRFVKNTITQNTEYGISFNWSQNQNYISENYIAQNGKGMILKESSSNTIVGNTIKENNGWALQIEGGADNIIYHNHFVNNNVTDGLQVSIPGLWEPGVWQAGNPNVWDDGEKGNYWSDYFTRYPNASEIGDTSIGDTPFYINPNNIDHYPVTEYDAIPEFPMLSILPVLLSSALLVLFFKKRVTRYHQ
ncbi:MAG: NosD domain-containing protein [Candidatus Bathyarchaeia archaeon]|jgi:parallel beta-helix repeat protein